MNRRGQMEWIWQNKHRGKDNIYSGGKAHQGGVALILDEKSRSESLISCWGVSDKVTMATITAHPFIINVIQVYAPSADHPEEEMNNPVELWSCNVRLECQSRQRENRTVSGKNIACQNMMQLHYMSVKFPMLWLAALSATEYSY